MGKAKRCHGNWEPSADSMFFHSFPTHHQLPSISLPVHSSFHCFSPASPHSFLFALSITTTPLSPFSLSLSVCHIPPLLPASLALYINHTLVFLHHLTLSSLTAFISTHSLFFSPPFFFSIFLSPPLFLFSQLLRLNPQLCAKSSKEETERLKSNIKKKETEKENKTPSGCPQALISEEGRWKGRKRGQKGRNTFYEDRVISLRARM